MNLKGDLVPSPRSTDLRLARTGPAASGPSGPDRTGQAARSRPMERTAGGDGRRAVRMRTRRVERPRTALADMNEEDTHTQTLVDVYEPRSKHAKKKNTLFML